MNPPPSADGNDAAPEYAGAEPLDIALADRFAFIASVPALGELAREDQLAILGGLEQADDGAVRLRAAVDAVRRELDGIAPFLQKCAAEYTQIIAAMGPAAVHGIHWYYGPPPIIGLEIEIDVRAIRQELRL